MEGPHILFLDIETAAILGWAWNKYETDLVDVYRDWSILCFCAKWSDGPPEIYAIDPPKSLEGFLRNKNSDKKIVKVLWKLLDKADWVVAHNGDAFDVKKIQARFLYYNLPPPSPFKTVDTKKAVKKVSANTSNKLDDLGKLWDIGRKMPHEGWNLWLQYMSGDPRARSVMHRYNKQDVLLLERVYHRLLPWITNLNLGVYSDLTMCPNCQSRNLNRRGNYVTRTMVYARIRCMDCGKWMRSSGNLKVGKPLVGI